MKPAPFRYLRPSSIDEVIDLLAEHRSEAAVLAGGQSLVPLLNQRQRRPSVVIDLAGVAELGRTAIGVEEVELGALVGQRLSPEVTAALPLLGLALPHVGHVQTRNRGTIAGSMAHGDPLAEIPLAMLVGGGDVELASTRGRRRLSIDEFLDRAFEPARADDELLLATHWHRPPRGAGHAFLELASSTTVAAVAAMVVVEDGIVTSARVGVAGPVDRPALLEVGPEAAATSEVTSAATLGRSLASQLLAEVRFVDDGGSDPDHRRAVAIELVGRALTDAVIRSQRASDAAPATSAQSARDAEGIDHGEAGADGAPGRSTSVAAEGEVPVVLAVDGRELSAAVEARTSLADAVRAVGVTGVKLGCEQGVCGSCTVLLDGESQRSCLVLAVQAEGVEITTAAGLAGPIDELRSAFVDHFAVQCGFCASGVLVTAAAELAERERNGTLNQLDQSTVAGLLSGNVCRCTGYGSMVAAITQAAERLGQRVETETRSTT